MDDCPPLCPCWPRPQEAPFSLCEQDFLAAGVDYDVSIPEYMTRMDGMAQLVGADRLGHLLSVPVKLFRTWVATPWLRLSALWMWTMDEAIAMLFARQMLKFGACPALTCIEAHGAPLSGWEPGSSQHPGRPGSVRFSTSPRLGTTACSVLLHKGFVGRGKQAQRWDRRVARVQWVSCVHGSQLAFQRE